MTDSVNSTANTPAKKKKASGWDKWKAKKKAEAVAKRLIEVLTSPPTGLNTPIVPTVALKNHFAIILDRSGSMGRIRESTVRSFNEQVQTVKEASKGQSTDVSLFTFSSRVDTPTFFAAPVESMTELTNYYPSGNTALNDAVIYATDKLSALPDANDPSTSFLVVIITDGEENHSQHSAKDVANRINTLQATKRWTFTYVGADVDLSKVADLGLYSGNIRSFNATRGGVAAMTSLNSMATNSYFEQRNLGSTQTLDLYERAEKALLKQQEEEAKKKANTTT